MDNGIYIIRKEGRIHTVHFLGCDDYKPKQERFNDLTSAKKHISESLIGYKKVSHSEFGEIADERFTEWLERVKIAKKNKTPPISPKLANIGYFGQTLNPTNSTDYWVCVNDVVHQFPRPNLFIGGVSVQAYWDGFKIIGFTDNQYMRDINWQTHDDSLPALICTYLMDGNGKIWKQYIPLSDAVTTKIVPYTIMITSPNKLKLFNSNEEVLIRLTPKSTFLGENDAEIKIKKYDKNVLSRVQEMLSFIDLITKNGVSKHE